MLPLSGELNIIIHHQKASENCHRSSCSFASLDCVEVFFFPSSFFVLLCVIWCQHSQPPEDGAVTFIKKQDFFKEYSQCKDLK